MNTTNTEGTRVVCFRIHMGAMRPSGYSGEDGVKGERGEWAELYCGSSGRRSLRGGNGLVHQHDLEGLGLLRLPDGDLALRDERITESRRENVEWILSGLRGRGRVRTRWSLRWMRLRVQSGHEHDGCELHEQLGGIRVHSGLDVGGGGFPRATAVDHLFVARSFCGRQQPRSCKTSLPGPRSGKT
ncbi:hypothetical protein K466DRAFT_328710 [Polyporus arcularius HHB13444]|uniref:Uncharacterized protein n=1 Tax=Polyporus arcularius HHB13444 TaxID=1314778 RepID=A0A5C3NZB4_9APHY|nr:hypothetical protein K466DRAFT_328710 [Polyporus arcularius HHB13444]